jgi:hypothetical protein
MRNFLFIFFFSLTAIAQAPLIEWQKSLGGSSFDEGTDVIFCSDNTIVFFGVTGSNDGDVMGSGSQDYWLGKLDINGTLLWQ